MTAPAAPARAEAPPSGPRAYRQRLGELKQERQSFEVHWRELAEYYLPRRARFTVTDRNRGEKPNSKIIDNTPTMATRTLSSGMMAGLTSPARKWFRLSTPDADMNELASVKRWLASTEDRISEVFNRSNVYAVLPLMYQDLGVFGTSAFAILEDDQDVIRAYHFPVGTFYLANSHRMAVDTFYREFSLTVRQVVTQFGLKPDGTIDWTNISVAVKNQWEQGSKDHWVELLHVIEPNDIVDAGNAAGQRMNRRMPWRSCYLERNCSDGADQEKALRESGFEEFPIVAPRWTLLDSDIYGTSPGMDALGDVKSLQLEQKRKMQAIDKLVNPPMNAPASLKRGRAKMLPGDVNYVDSTGQNQGLQPAYQIKPEIGQLLEDIRENQDRINRAFYVDLFLMLTNTDRREITAREIDERHEEKLLMLGPVLERLNGEQNDPLIDRTFAIMLRRGMLDEPPEELSGVQLKVEYISMLAQAQKAVGTAGIERLTQFALSVAAVHPDILDRVDFDEAAEEYGSMVGVPPKVVRTDEDVAALREQRQQQQQAMNAAAAAQPAAAATKDLGTTPMQGDTALSRLMAANGQGIPPQVGAPAGAAA